ncbi:MAG: hypothetical protein JNJ57_04605 [Saprospiraceae bacterium]|nr:hypothetical protein [Saprospiraceae bacterium]
MKNLIFFLLACLIVFSACPGGKKCNGCDNGECVDGACECEDWAYDNTGSCDGLYR